MFPADFQRFKKAARVTTKDSASSTCVWQQSSASNTSSSSSSKFFDRWGLSLSSKLKSPLLNLINHFSHVRLARACSPWTFHQNMITFGWGFLHFFNNGIIIKLLGKPHEYKYRATKYNMFFIGIERHQFNGTSRRNINFSLYWNSVTAIGRNAPNIGIILSSRAGQSVDSTVYCEKHCKHEIFNTTTHR